MVRVSKRERLMNLVAALLASRAPLPFRDVVGRVVGYDDGAADDALEKRFDRDKAELRRLGIPVEYQNGDGDLPAGYIIPKDRVFQQKVRFTPQESMLLSIAGRVGAAATGGGPLEEALKSALRKLAVDLNQDELWDGMDSVTVLRARSGDPRALANVSALTSAVTSSRRVRVTYAALASGQKTMREINPYGMGLLRGAWYVVGHCHLRNGLRMFKVARILGRVTLMGPADNPTTFRPPEDFRIEDHLSGEPWEIGDGAVTQAQILASADVPSAALSFAKPLREVDTGIIYEAAVRRADAFVAWILGWGGQVQVVGPSELRAFVAEEARRLAARYVPESEVHATAAAQPLDQAVDGEESAS